MIKLRALFQGRVQGVGFRSTVVDKATRLNLVGTVQNLPNGSVELIGEGDKKVLEQLIHEIKRERFDITNITLTFSSDIVGYPDFRIC